MRRSQSGDCPSSQSSRVVECVIPISGLRFGPSTQSRRNRALLSPRPPAPTLILALPQTTIIGQSKNSPESSQAQTIIRATIKSFPFILSHCCQNLQRHINNYKLHQALTSDKFTVHLYGGNSGGRVSHPLLESSCHFLSRTFHSLPLRFD